jgi:hypothetical protein
MEALHKRNGVGTRLEHMLRGSLDLFGPLVNNTIVVFSDLLTPLFVALRNTSQ